MMVLQFPPLAENSSVPPPEAMVVAAVTEDVVDVESVDSSEGPATLASGSISSNEDGVSRSNEGCARTMGLMPHHFGEMKLRLRASVEAASVRRRNRIVSEDDDGSLLETPGKGWSETSFVHFTHPFWLN